MINVTCRRPFSELGDQQLLEQTRRLAANQRCLEVHILDHLDEIDRRGLALRRGFSSLFDYAVRELRFTDAAAQRRIQAMRLCRRHGWVRASLHSGELSMPAAAQLETTFAGAERAERAERQSRTGRHSRTGLRNGGQGRCHDQEKDDDPRRRTVSSRAARRVPVAAAPSSDDGRAPHLSPTIRSTHAPEPVAAPSPSLPVASRGPDSPRDDPFAELSPGPLSVAPLLHPQRQRELIKQAAGMSTRQVAGLLADAAPEVVPPRDTLRAVAPDRYTLKVSIDQECEQGLRLLKGLLSHLDPRMSWGDLVARVVREAVARHDPRGGDVPVGRTQHGSGRRTRHMLPGRRPRRLSAETNPRGGRRTLHSPLARRLSEAAILQRRRVTRRAESRCRPDRLSAQAPILRRRRVPPPLPERGTRSRSRPTRLHRVCQRPLHRHWAHVQVAFQQVRPSPLRRRSRHSAWTRTADRAAHHQRVQRRTQAVVLSATPTNPRRGATFLRLFVVSSGIATKAAACIAIRSLGGSWTDHI